MGRRIRHALREGLLIHIVHADAQHKEIESLLENPIDLLFPLFRAPMLGLEPVEAAVRKVAKSAIHKARRLAHVESIWKIDSEQFFGKLDFFQSQARGPSSNTMVSSSSRCSGFAGSLIQKMDMPDP